MEPIELSVKDTVEDRALSDNVTNRYVKGKRIFDMIASGIGILLLLPVFFIVGIAIKLDSAGPIIFPQERVGYKGKLFKMYKFRSMMYNAEAVLKSIEDKSDVKGNMFKMKSDPRVTRVGKLIRKTSIDELPQLYNVLIGDMSLVGPRPPLVREVAKYKKWHNLRMSVRPGITGLWQISGRNLVGFDEMVRLDLKYIRERSFWYDLKIIFRTIPVLLGDSKAF